MEVMSMYSRLWSSRKVRIAVIDAVLAAAILIVTTFVAPEQQQFWLALIGILQVPVVVLIGGIAYEDGQAKRSGHHLASLSPPATEQISEAVA
jgi:peptidoglycan/LPS O-acetylase OafA/YrhL